MGARIDEKPAAQRRSDRRSLPRYGCALMCRGNVRQNILTGAASHSCAMFSWYLIVAPRSRNISQSRRCPETYHSNHHQRRKRRPTSGKRGLTSMHYLGFVVLPAVHRSHSLRGQLSSYDHLEFGRADRNCNLWLSAVRQHRDSGGAGGDPCGSGAHGQAEKEKGSRSKASSPNRGSPKSSKELSASPVACSAGD